VAGWAALYIYASLALVQAGLIAEGAMALALIVLAGFLALAFLPQIWVQRVIARHSADRPDFPGTGGEFARHLLDRLGLAGVGVEESKLGDHYDPDSKTVRLLPAHMRGRSLAAIVIAAHEVGHAVQDATGYAPLKARTRLAKQAQKFETVGSIVMLAAPLLVLIAKSPHILLLQMFLGLLILGMTVLIHASTLPTEYDASFRRALPILKAGQYLRAEDMPAARQILRAAALTYVAAAAGSLLNVMRWLRVLRI
jgi:Zn-dependent membrane protease YugP